MTYYEFLITVQLTQSLSILTAIVMRFKQSRLSLLFLGLLIANVFYLSIASFIYLNFGAETLVAIHGTMALNIVAIGPLLYFYLKSEYLPKFRISRSDGKHLVPLIYILGVSFYLMFMDKAERLKQLHSPVSFTLVDFLQLSGLAILSFYTYMAFDFIRHYQKQISNVSSLPSFLAMRWAYGLVFFSTGILIFAFIVWIFGIQPTILTLALEFMILGMVVVSVFSHKYSKFFHDDIEELNLFDNFEKNFNWDDGSKIIANDEKYKNSPLSDEQMQHGISRINELLAKNDGSLCNPNFRLSDLAKLIKMPPYLTSQVINQGLNKSFYDLVNETRIAQAKKLLVSKQHLDLSVLDVAYEVGYNSKSAFNSAFKKYTHSTPSEFRRNGNRLSSH